MTRPHRRRAGPATRTSNGRRRPSTTGRRRAGNPRRRCAALLAAVLFAFSGVTLRLGHLQVVAPEAYAERGMSQRLHVAEIPAERGSIFDRNGNELALSVNQHAVWADPLVVADPAAAARALAPLLGVDEDDLKDGLTGDARFVYLARQVDDATADEVAGLEIEGVELLDEPQRFRPAGELAVSLLGEVDIDNRGLSGLERQFEERLAGAPGELLVERGPDGATIVGGDHRVRPATRGDDLVLTIDRSLQYQVERSLAEQVVATDANGGMAVVMNPGNGEILAMASIGAAGESASPRPTSDNAPLTSVFEPGSVSKVMTLSALLEEGMVVPDDVMSVPDSLEVGPKRFTDSSPHETQPMSVAEVLSQSSNVGTIMLAQELGAERLDDYLRTFGLGQPTGLDFPGESAGLVPELEDWASTSLGSIAIGQGVAVTAVQMLSAINAVANDGLQVEPRLVSGVIDAAGQEHPIQEPSSRPVISSGTAEEMTAMLVKAVTDGTGINASVDGYEVAGKTGTAQKPSTEIRGYEPGAYMGVFAGFVPAEDPQLSAIVVLDEPHPYYGGVVAAPVFAEIAEYALRLFRVPPPVGSGPVEVETGPPTVSAVPRD